MDHLSLKIPQVTFAPGSQSYASVSRSLPQAVAGPSTAPFTEAVSLPPKGALVNCYDASVADFRTETPIKVGI